MIYEGAALSMTAGEVRPANGADTSFAGFAYESADNTGGAAGAIDVRVLSRGIVKLPVTGVTAGTTNVGTAVYASDDGSFTTTATANLGIGRVHRVVATGEAMVAFESSGLRSLDTTEV